MLSLTLYERNLIVGGGTVSDKESIISKIIAVHEATLLLQRNVINLADVRNVFDYLLEANSLIVNCSTTSIMTIRLLMT